MKVKVLFFDDDASDSYFHLCDYIHKKSSKKGKIRWFRNVTAGGHKENWLSVHRDGLCEHTHALNDTSVFDYLMDKFGTLEGTYAEVEL